jgi:hypothetical protein
LAPSPKRYARQIILAEIGPDGQARLEMTTFCPGGALSPDQSRFSALYAKRAGLLVDVDSGAPADRDAASIVEGPVAKAFRHEPSRDIAVGAARTLQGILQALTLSPSQPNNVNRIP